MSRKHFAALAFAAVTGTAAQGQDSAKVILPGTPVRITLSDASVVRGRADSTTASSFALSVDGTPRLFPIAELRKVELRKSRAGRYALYGGIGGAVLGAVGGYVLPRMFCQYETIECSGDPAAGVFIVTGPAAVLGAFTGAFVEDWRVEPRGARVAPENLSAPGTAARLCRSAGSAYVGIGNTFGGGLASTAGTSFLCRGRRAMGLEIGYADLPDDRLESNGPFSEGSTTTRSAGHISLLAEHSLVGRLRGVASIDAAQYSWTVRSDGSSFAFPGRRRGIGLGGGLVTSVPLGSGFALRGDVRMRIATMWGTMGTIGIGVERAR